MASLSERYRDVLRHGHLAAARGKRAEALEAYEAAARMPPRRAVPRIGIGRMHVALGDLDAAREAFLLALAIEPDKVDAVDGLARLDGASPVEPVVAGHEAVRARPPTRARPLPPFMGVPADPPGVRAAADGWDAALAADDVDGCSMRP